MKSIYSKRSLIVIFAALLFCTVAYSLLPREFRWAMEAIIEVPACTARVTEKLGITADFVQLKTHIIQSLQLGMTPEEVVETLNQFGEVHIKNSFVDEDQETNMEVLIELCDNPFGNMVLLVYYTNDGRLKNVVDPYEE